MQIKPPSVKIAFNVHLLMQLKSPVFPNKKFSLGIISLSICLLVSVASYSFPHEILFCGEQIPVNNNMVGDKLMNVIRRQIPNVNLPQLRQRVKSSFPIVEYYLRKTGLPEDFKYLAIVESGFQNLTSVAGARGFWQLMPETARERGLYVSPELDERDDIYKSTYAACKVLASYYLDIRRRYGISSWVLTAAAYNFGIGNISNAINRQGKDYFTMNLNPETAVYVYRIIAVKELFEYPELYMKDFGYNVFNASKKGAGTRTVNGQMDTSAFLSMTVKVAENDGKHPKQVTLKEPPKPVNAEMENEQAANESDANQSRYLAATVKGKYRNFQDGDLVAIELLENLEVKGSFNRKGNQLKGKGWIIDDRIYIDLGYGEHDVSLLDINRKKGIPISALKNDKPVLLKVVK
jgi:membrane-bound lytic murein transglycosylase D